MVDIFSEYDVCPLEYAILALTFSFRPFLAWILVICSIDLAIAKVGLSSIPFESANKK